MWEHSYQVYPWDAPKYNPPGTIIRQLGDYPLISDFYNFVIGIPYSDAENTFNTEQSYRDRVADVRMWDFPGTLLPPGATLVAGMDVGKICHFSLGLLVGRELHVVYTEKILNTRSSPATSRVMELVGHFKPRKVCIDAGPDISLVNYLVSNCQQLSAVVYVRAIKGLLPYEVKGDGEVINADRTKMLKELLARHNTGEIHYPSRDDVKEEIFKHLATTKKIRDRSSDGDTVERFVKTSSEDHWVHSLNYMQLAAMLVGYSSTKASVVGVLPGIRKVRVGSATKPR